jgi:hypothetical protein
VIGVIHTLDPALEDQEFTTDDGDLRRLPSKRFVASSNPVIK